MNFAEARKAMTSNKAYRGKPSAPASGGGGVRFANAFPKYDTNQKMATGFGSVFGSSSGSTGSSQAVQDSLNFLMNENIGLGLNPEDAVNKAFDDFYFDSENVMDIPPGQVGVDEIFLDQFSSAGPRFGGGSGGIGSLMGDAIGYFGGMMGGPKPGGYEEPKIPQQRLMQRMIDLNRNNPFTQAAMSGIGSLIGMAPRRMMR
jgi:hypothetical protein